MSEIKHIIVKITNEYIFFNDSLQLPLANTNLPIGQFRFVESRTIYWELEMIKYEKENAILEVIIINFRPTNVDKFTRQQPKGAIKIIHFSSIFWPAFSADLSFYKKSPFIPLLTEIMLTSDRADEKVVHITAKIPFAKTRFGAGFIEFDYKFLWSESVEKIKVYNSHILPEFDHIKPYFSKHFNSRTFEVLMVVVKIKNSTKAITATSRQIEEIKDVAIETMKFVKTERLRKPPKYIKEVDKSLFTADDIFHPFDKNMLGTYPMTHKELFDQIMKWEDIRNKKQLEYLSGLLHDTSEKVRFTLTPKFGFLFVAKGDQMIHYIWEMLNSNATYIWSFDPTLWTVQTQLRKMEEVISFIRNHGRDVYIRNVSPQEEVLFRRIMHQGAGSQLVDHFPKWRNLVNESIV